MATGLQILAPKSNGRVTQNYWNKLVFSQKISDSSRKNTENVSVNQCGYYALWVLPTENVSYVWHGNIAVIIAKYFRQKLFHNIEANTYAWIDRNLQT